MAKRHRDALAIQEGACNPSGIAHSIVTACQEIRAEPNHTGTAQITSDPAVRLMIHQLAFICRANDDQIGEDYHHLTTVCENAD
jgi:hypothetical protein